MSFEVSNTIEGIAARSVNGFSDADAIALGLLVEMAYKMSGQGLDPPIPSDFPKDYDVVANITMVDSVTGGGGTREFYGFIAHSKATGTNDYVMAIRGTIGIVEWIIDLRSFYAIPFHGHGNVGSGFADTYASLNATGRGAAMAGSAGEAKAGADRPFAAQVADIIANHAARTMAVPDLPPPSLALTGHSLGSALITLYAVHRLAWPTVPLSKCYTFASPLVGDQTFADAFNALEIGRAYRIFDDWDPIPYLPALVGFEPVNTAHPISLSSSFWFPFNPKCSHSMDTYLNHFDPRYPAATACNSILPEATVAAQSNLMALGMGGAVEGAGTRRPAQEPGRPPTSTTHTTSIVHGSTTVTITVQTDG